MAKEKNQEEMDLEQEETIEDKDNLEDQDTNSEEEIVEEKGQEQEDPYKDQLIRLTADFTNYKRRVDKEKRDYLSLGVKKIALDLLGVLDNFERAIDHAEEETSFKEGVEMIYQQLIDLLKKNNICPMEALNEKFDPNLHHAVLVEEKDGVEEGIVIDVMQKGYMINDEVLRPAMVKVSQ